MDSDIQLDLYTSPIYLIVLMKNVSDSCDLVSTGEGIQVENFSVSV